MARKILLADDSVTAQNMGRKILTDAGYEVMTVNNGSAALKRVTEQKPDLIVLDVYMPGYSGLEVCQRLKDSRDTSRIPILLTVGKLEPFKPEDARRVSADAFIVKPFEASELLSALTRLEDRIVPQGDTTRFSPTVSGIERFVGDTTGKSRPDTNDSGWKNRIRIPSRKSKREEPEPHTDSEATPSFRDFRRGAAKPPVEAKSPIAEKASAETASPRQEPGLVPDIPHDITPDELDALSTLVAKLDGPIPQAEEIAPIGDTIGSSSIASDLKIEHAVQDGTEPAAAVTQAAESARVEEAAQANVAADVEAPAGVSAATIASPATEFPASSPEEQAPVDGDDEPFFATAASAVPETGEDPASAEPRELTSALPTQSVAAIPDQASQREEEQQQVPAAQESGNDQRKVEEMLAEVVAEQAIADPAVVERAPTEEELAEALRFLTPTHDSNSTDTHGAASFNQQEPAIASSVSGQEANTAYPANGSRWRAEAVELTPEEMQISLEAEMFRPAVPAPIREYAAAAAANGAVSNDVHEAETVTTVSQSIAEPAPPATGDAQTVACESAAATPTQSQAAEEASQQQTSEPVCAPFASHYAVPESSGDETANLASDTLPAPADEPTAGSANQDMTGDQESMGKKSSADKGKISGWHQIRAAATPSPDADVVEAAKQPEGEAQAPESPKAMAAAAASDDSASSPDPKAIASIVDSVLADLRPRIVEEIAKKLGKK